MDFQITRLDFLAAAALQGLLAHPDTVAVLADGCVTVADIEKTAVEIASRLMVAIDETQPDSLLSDICLDSNPRGMTSKYNFADFEENLEVTKSELP